MDDREQAALEALTIKYGHICPGAVARAYARALSRYRGAREVDKAARAALHQMTHAYLPDSALRRARKCLNARRAGDRDALSQVLALHASTGERGDGRALFERVFARIGRPARVLDLACGLNPLALGAMGVSVTGYEVNRDLVEMVNDWAALEGFDVRAEWRDLLAPQAFPEADLALLMKLMPVLEAEQAGSAAALLARIPARHLLITFPTRSLSGRSVGMAAHYRDWFEKNCPASRFVIDSFEWNRELCFLTEGHHG